MTDVRRPATVAVVGAGAIGMTIGAALAAAGHEVVACAPRRPERDAILVELLGAERAPDQTAEPPVEWPVRWCTDPGGVRPVEWVVLATKIHQTEAARAWLDALVGEQTAIIAAQNGVDHRERLARLTAAPVAPALVYYNAERVGVGHVRVRPTERDLVLPDDETGRAAAAFVGAAGIRALADPDFTTAAWLKLLTNAAANPITALTGRRIEVLTVPAVAALARDVLREAAAVGRAEGADLPADVAEERLTWLQRLRPGSTTSMLQDKDAGRPLEHDGLTGAIVRAGERHGIPTPANAALLALLMGLSAGQDAEADRRSGAVE